MAGMSDALMLKHTFGSTKRSGDWSVPERIVLRQRMGSTDLDFTSARFAGGTVVLEIDAFGGSIELRVPSGMAVASDVRTTFASYEDHRKDIVGDAAAPAMTITGRMTWGSIEVRGPRKR
jgi:predicted membrane protein